MKLSKIKVLASIVAAVAVASMATVSVSAADYGWEPPAASAGSSDTASTGSTSTGDTDSGSGSDSGIAAEATVTKADVEAAIKSGKAVKISADGATVKEDAIAAIAAQKKVVKFDAGDYTISIDPAKITKVGAINLGMEIEEDADGLVITPAAKGDFGMTLTITIPATKLGDINAKKAHVFYVADDGTVTDLGKVKANSNGSVSFSITHASYYVISEEDLASEDGDASIEDGDGETDGEIDVVVNPGDDANPITGVGLVTGAALVSAAAVALTSKKRK